jgi:hypothetical protein
MGHETKDIRFNESIRFFFSKRHSEQVKSAREQYIQNQHVGLPGINPNSP